jgi:hypothetical protein
MSAVFFAIWQAISEVMSLIHPHASSSHGHHLAGSASSGGPWPVPILVISVSIMALVVLSAEALLHLVGAKLTPIPPPVVTHDQAATDCWSCASTVPKSNHFEEAAPATNGSQSGEQPEVPGVNPTHCIRRH